MRLPSAGAPAAQHALRAVPAGAGGCARAWAGVSTGAGERGGKKGRARAVAGAALAPPPRSAPSHRAVRWPSILPLSAASGLPAGAPAGGGGGLAGGRRVRTGLRGGACCGAVRGAEPFEAAGTREACAEAGVAGAPRCASPHPRSTWRARWAAGCRRPRRARQTGTAGPGVGTSGGQWVWVGSAAGGRQGWERGRLAACPRKS
jgi:hypothetical protein